MEQVASSGIGTGTLLFMSLATLIIVCWLWLVLEHWNQNKSQSAPLFPVRQQVYTHPGIIACETTQLQERMLLCRWELTCDEVEDSVLVLLLSVMTVVEVTTGRGSMSSALGNEEVNWTVGRVTDGLVGNDTSPGYEEKREERDSKVILMTQSFFVRVIGTSLLWLKKCLSILWIKSVYFKARSFGFGHTFTCTIYTVCTTMWQQLLTS